MAGTCPGWSWRWCTDSWQGRGRIGGNSPRNSGIIAVNWFAIWMYLGQMNFSAAEICRRTDSLRNSANLHKSDSDSLVFGHS